MRPETSFVRTISYVGAAAREARLKAFGGVTAQYVYKYDEDGLHLKIVGDLTPKKAIVTQTVVWGSDPPDVVTIELDYEKEAKVYPLNIGCPVDCYIYIFKDFSCPGERELRFYFSKGKIDLGAGPAFVIGVADQNLEAFQAIFPCTKS